MRYFLELAYNGGAYCGWQRQPESPSVQQYIEQALEKLLRHKINLVGCGRTDTGVNASYYVAHFDSDASTPDRMRFKLNAILPGDIAILSIREAASEFHARFDATKRQYTYYIRRNKCPFTRHSSWQYYIDLDVDAMNRAAKMLLHHNDFETFSKLHSSNKTTLCQVTKSEWTKDGDQIIYVIESDRFLRNMIRSLVATMVDVGRGKITPERFGEILHSHDRSLGSGSAPAQGLFLSNVEY